jgi:hypothetical protein
MSEPKKIAAHSDNPQDADVQWAKIRRGWYFGGDSFRNEMMEAWPVLPHVLM